MLLGRSSDIEGRLFIVMIEPDSGSTNSCYYVILQSSDSVFAAFLDQLQTLQQSLSSISGVLGFADHSEVPPKATTNGTPALPSLPEDNWRSNGLFMTENETVDLDVSHQGNVTPAAGDDRISSPEVSASNASQNHSRPTSPRMLHFQEIEYNKSGSRSLFKWKSDSEALMPKEFAKDVTTIRWVSVFYRWL